MRIWGNGWRCFVSRCLWPAVDNKKTYWMLGLDKASLSLVAGFIKGHCEIWSLTWIFNRSQPDYCRACCDEEEYSRTLPFLLCLVCVISTLPILPFPTYSPFILFPLLSFFKGVVQWINSTSEYCTCLNCQVHVL